MFKLIFRKENNICHSFSLNRKENLLKDFLTYKQGSRYDRYNILLLGYKIYGILGESNDTH